MPVRLALVPTCLITQFCFAAAPILRFRRALQHSQPLEPIALHCVPFGGLR